MERDSTGGHNVDCYSNKSKNKAGPYTEDYVYSGLHGKSQEVYKYGGLETKSHPF